MKQLKYVYGITVSKNSTNFKKVRTIESHGLIAIVKDVPEHEFGEAYLTENVRNADWMTKKVLFHHNVLEAYSRDHYPLIPFSFGTLFSSDESVLDLLSDSEEQFKATLSKVAGKQEWGIKLFYNNKHLELYLKNQTDSLVSMTKKMATVTQGQHFILKKEYTRLLKQEKKAWLNRKREVLYDVVDSIDGAIIHHLENTSNEVLQKDDPNILNMAVLLDREITITELQKKIESGTGSNSAYLYTELSGPWPPYNFC